MASRWRRSRTWAYTVAVFDVIQRLLDGPDYPTTLTAFTCARERELRELCAGFRLGFAHNADPGGTPGPATSWCASSRVWSWPSCSPTGPGPRRRLEREPVRRPPGRDMALAWPPRGLLAAERPDPTHFPPPQRPYLR
ncbi:hypothetical protein KNE206_53880 [Kitasatospora sp. NE20-6]